MIKRKASAMGLRVMARHAAGVLLAVVLAGVVAGVVTAGGALAQSPPPERAAGLLGRALAEGQAGDWDRAAATVAPAGAVAAALVEWHRLRAGAGDWRAVARFAAERGDWPGIDGFRARAEATLAGSAPPPAVRAFFADAPPATGAGAVALVAALGTLGDAAGAEAAALAAWRGMLLTEAEEGALRAAHGPALAAADAERLDMLLWRHARAGAERQAARMGGGWPALAAARLGLHARAPGVDGLVSAVPAALAGDPGLAFERFDWRMSRQFHDTAGDLLLERSEAGTLGRPEAWMRGRAFLARQALAAGDAARAYALAAGHGLEDGGAFADMEWFAGYVALRHLGDPERGLRHFQRLRVRVGSPISLSRAGYWEGRAHEALGEAENAAAAYAFAAEHQTGFYGLLAAERAGLPMDPSLAGGDLAAWQAAGFAGSELLAAVQLLRGAGEWHSARRFVLHLAGAVPEAELAALGAWALALDEPNWAVNIAKLAATREVVLIEAGFPLALPEVEMPEVEMPEVEMPVAPALALAIARRESEFDPQVVSPANAQGLMQLLPGTGRLMADALGVEFAEPMLRSDPGLNVRLGTAYLARLQAEFGPSLALVAAGYNAGPGRPRDWIGRLGDPRGMDEDALIDWIERVPFAETRNYIMRVGESLMIYRARLEGGPVPLDLVAVLRGR